ncbi:methyl-accepting chemotaxis protein [Paenibacillus chartarius]|uniref:Methyl-accepting chemotaxis protein n=1 Tax=Paenibacillus chartarius TaxID=747481 RepID=A0ABV6DGE5_9BACL
MELITLLLKNLRVSYKLVILVSVLLIFMGGISASALYSFQVMNRSITDMYENRLLAIKWLNDMRVQNRGMESDMLYMAGSQNKEMISFYHEDFQTRENKLGELMGQYMATPLDPEEQELLVKHDRLIPQYKEIRTQIVNDAVNGKKAEAVAALAGSRELLKSINDIYTSLADYNAAAADEVKKQVDRQIAQARQLITVSLIVALLLGGGMAYFIVRMITKPLRSMQSLMLAAEQGDLTGEGAYRSRDEIGMLTESFNNMVGGLRSVIRQVQGTAELVAASSQQLTASAEETGRSSEQISQTIQELAIGTEKQVYAVQQSSSVSQDISRRIEEIGVSSKQAVAYSEQAAERAGRGTGNVANAIDSMHAIDENVTDLKLVVSSLSERSKQIGDIVQLISGIASQTNLLALNAAIEAARAGEEGRGFAVVASEVRKLAEQTSVAAQEITSLIRAVQTESENAASSMETTSKKVTEGSAIIQSLGATFEGIKTVIEESLAHIQTVSSSIGLAQEGTASVVTSMQAVAEVAEQSAAGSQNVTASTEEQLAAMEQVTASANNLTHMAQELQTLASRFRV